jgi:hypothetical protein
MKVQDSDSQNTDAVSTAEAIWCLTRQADDHEWRVIRFGSSFCQVITYTELEITKSITNLRFESSYSGQKVTRKKVSTAQITSYVTTTTSCQEELRKLIKRNCLKVPQN